MVSRCSYQTAIFSLSACIMEGFIKIVSKQSQNIRDIFHCNSMGDSPQFSFTYMTTIFACKIPYHNNVLAKRIQTSQVLAMAHSNVFLYSYSKALNKIYSFLFTVGKEPMVLAKLQDVHAQGGRPVTLECEVSPGEPKANFRWWVNLPCLYHCYFKLKINKIGSLKLVINIHTCSVTHFLAFWSWKNGAILNHEA